MKRFVHRAMYITDKPSYCQEYCTGSGVVERKYRKEIDLKPPLPKPFQSDIILFGVFEEKRCLS